LRQHDVPPRIRTVDLEEVALAPVGVPLHHVPKELGDLVDEALVTELGRATSDSPAGCGRREADGQPLDAPDQRDAERLERHRITGDLDVWQSGK